MICQPQILPNLYFLNDLCLNLAQLKHVSAMVKIYKKARNTHNFKSITGCSLKLVVEKREKSINISVLNSTRASVFKKALLLFTVTVINLITFVFNLLNIRLITAIFFATLYFFYSICRQVKEENLVIVKGLGLQLTTKYIVGFKTMFIPQNKVQTIFINEVIFRHKVIFVLMLLTKELENSEKLVPLFFDTRPRLSCLEVIYKHIKGLDK